MGAALGDPSRPPPLRLRALQPESGKRSFIHSSIDISIFNDFFSADPLALVGALQGIDYLVQHRVLRAEPQAVADFLNKTPGLYKKSIGTYDHAAGAAYVDAGGAHEWP